LVRVAPTMLPQIYGRTAIANDYRSIGTTRIIVGPPPHQLPMVHVAPTPLRSLSLAMPRSQVVVRAGMPLNQRPYYAPNVNRPGPPRPGYPAPGYNHPSSPAPGYNHPSYPAPAPGYNHPGYPAPAPGYNHPGYPAPAPGYNHP